MRYIVAVSGGVDSVVLLDMLVSGRLPKSETLIVAHFDHGIRDTSDADARFVEALARKYDLVYEYARVELGKNASEAEAREKRYQFLRKVAKKHNAVIVTAHHQDDLIETIAINLTRGTGWRGLAVFGSKDLYRPLLDRTKTELYDYALAHNLEWVEDETNTTDVYLRNRIRRKLGRWLKASDRKKLIEYWAHQQELRIAIETEDQKLLGSDSHCSRYFFTHIDEDSATELLRAALGFSLTRPQTTRLLHTIKTAKAGSVMEVGAGQTVRFTVRDFIVETP